MPIISNFIVTQTAHVQSLQKIVKKRYERLTRRERLIIYTVGAFILLVVTAVVVVAIRQRH